MFLKYFKHPRARNRRAAALKWVEKYAPFPLVYASAYLDRPALIKIGRCYKTKSEITHVLRTKFEDMEACIPTGWECYLTRMYGNYMQLPPVEQQIGHHSVNLPDPFTPCAHTEILYWSDRQSRKQQAL